MNNQKGSTLVENMVSVALLAIFSLMVVTVLRGGISALGEVVAENNRMYLVYDEIESARSSNSLTAGDSTNIEENASMSYTFEKKNGTEVTQEIDGSFIYEEEQKLGEFYRD